MKNLMIPVGLSTNANFYFEGQDGVGEKGKLKERSFELTGSSPNIGKCLRLLGLNPTLIVPFEIATSLSHESKVLDFLLDELDIPHVRLRVLEKPPFAVVPIINGKFPSNSWLYGEKGIITQEESFLLKAENQINSLNGEFRIVAGIDKNLLRLGIKLLGENIGFRSFSPHHSLCFFDENHTYLKLMLSKSDEMILNEAEFKALNLSFEDIHNLGVRAIIVTMGERGGAFSLCNESTNFKPIDGSFLAADTKGIQLFLEGAGDSFNAAHLAWIIKNDLNFLSISLNQLNEACKFAASIASQKIQVRGATSYPDNLIF